jgi:DNA-directed RNA polymerase II subunit RPB2
MDATDQQADENDAWSAISAFFESTSMVQQQVSSFNKFWGASIQDIVDETPEIHVRSEEQHLPGGKGGGLVEYKLKMGDVYLSKPTVAEQDGEMRTLFPKEARLRNLTYSSAMNVDVKKTTITTLPTGERDEKVETVQRVSLGKVPVMLMSGMCNLKRSLAGSGHTGGERENVGECPHDEGKPVTACDCL